MDEPGPSSCITEGSCTDQDASEDNSEEDDTIGELIEVSPGEPDIVCKLCFLPAQDEASEVQLGSLYRRGDCCAHTYCLMFSCLLVQKGEDEEGIQGFLHKNSF